jgi:cleavage and polyadenylation specificity factor subunit 1
LFHLLINNSCRTVRNDLVSRPLTKGILDGALLDAFLELEAGKQAEITRQIGTSRAMIFRDLGTLSEPW